MDDNKSPSAAISLPKGGGAIKGIGETFQPNLFTGTGNFSIPIATTPGRAGFGPQLTLQYSTGNGNGSFGLGWQLSIPRITRKTEKGIPRYTDNDVFVMSGAEDLVPYLAEGEAEEGGDHAGDETAVSSSDDRPAVDPLELGGYQITRYRPRTEGLFARIEKWEKADDVHWRATTKDNVTSIYGKTKQARIADPAENTHVYEWLLEETFDAKGNHILYEYAKEAPDQKPNSICEKHRNYESQRYLRRIYYGNTPQNNNDEERLEPYRLVGPQRIGTHHRDRVTPLRRHYLFEVLFDYGDVSTEPGGESDTLITHYTPPTSLVDFSEEETPPEATDENWPLRPDPFSSYRSGFEIRTLRRCKRVLMFHHFQEIGGTTLVRSTDFEYHMDPATQLSLLEAVRVTGYRKTNGATYRYADVPPVTFKYTEFRPQQQRYKNINARGDNLPPLSLREPDLALVDVHGDGLPDVLHTTSRGYRYWENLGEGQLNFPHPQHVAPADVTLSQTGVVVGDIGADGLADLIVQAPKLPGFYEATPEGGWQPFKAFKDYPSFNLSDPNVRLVDLTGDGRSDVLWTRDMHFLWFECKGEEGYAEPQAVLRKHDLDEFPNVYFNDSSGRVRLADMSGDGLNDIVLLHNGRVDYWPNLGYGRFGRRITMATAPRLAANFDPKRLFLADLDGSGCADLVYVDFDRIRFWFNRSGNGWSEEQVIHNTPFVMDMMAIQFADLFGTGTATLVWSYDYHMQPGGNYKALDFCGGVKPYVLTEMNNNLGATTRVEYAPSTEYYLEDKAKGQPWVTNLPFPVHVVKKVEVIDHISKTKMVTSYKYHHGYYDGQEREFRGFGRVDQLDTEVFDDFRKPGLHDGETVFTNANRALHVPPVETRTWFHTGIYYDPDRTSSEDEPFDYLELTKKYRDEYYKGDPQAFELAEHEFKQTDDAAGCGQTPREAFRALRGSMLRTEIYGLDGTDPYLVSEARYGVKELQSKNGNHHAVYFAFRKESVSWHYERNPTDPRIAHDITLDIDNYGNITDSLSIGYARRHIPAELSDPHGQEAQGQPKIIYTKSNFINKVNDAAYHYVGVPYESRSYEVTGVQSRLPQDRTHLMAQDLIDADLVCSGLHSDSCHPFEWKPEVDSSTVEKRLIAWSRSYFRADDRAGCLDDLVFDHGDGCPTNGSAIPLHIGEIQLHIGEIQPLGLPYESYQAVLTDGLVKNIYIDRIQIPNDLEAAGYHREPDDDSVWWVPSGRQSFEPAGFYQPVKTRDPFGNVSAIDYDDYGLLVQRTSDALNNTISAENDYRVLQPQKITDPNDSHTIVAFDTLGMVVGTAIQSRTGEGDSFDTFETDLTKSQIRQNYLPDPLGTGAQFLGTATTRIIYDLWAYHDSVEEQREAQPPIAATLAREKHVNDSRGAGTARIQHSFLYSDGYGREIQSKAQAEPGLAPARDGSGGLIRDDKGNLVQHSTNPRWVGSGANVYNNKGNPVRQFEPFFSDTHQFTEPADLADEQLGVSPILFYDSMQRVVCILHPNHTYEKVVFDAWRQESWDVNDTLYPEYGVNAKKFLDGVLTHYSPVDDRDVGHYFKLLNTSDFLPSWFQVRTIPGHAQDKWPDDTSNPATNELNKKRREAERIAARNALAHAATPTITHLDALGRPFMTVIDNGNDSQGNREYHKTRIRLDIQGNDLVITDPMGIDAFQHDVDMLGHKLGVNSVDAGYKRVLLAVDEQPLVSWDANGHVVKTQYDQLRRQTKTWVSNPTHPNDFKLTQATLYGERLSSPQNQNHRGQVYVTIDGAGVVYNRAYDFKGNLLISEQRLADQHDGDVDWQGVDFDQSIADVETELSRKLESESFYSTAWFDALNRVIATMAPDHDQTIPLSRMAMPIPEHPSASDGTIYRYTYNEANLLNRIELNLRSKRLADNNTNAFKPFVTNIEYNARGQRTRITYGNNVSTEYTYDAETFRLLRLKSCRITGHENSEYQPGSKWLQDLHYCYDPAGNITQIEDSVFPIVFHSNQRICPTSRYVYDPVYRLVKAFGREHEAMDACHYTKGDKKHTEFISLTQSLNNGQALRNYTEDYTYDRSGNLLEIRHAAGPQGSWTRKQQYETNTNRCRQEYDEQLHQQVSVCSNRLYRTDAGCEAERYPASPAQNVHHDDNGNIVSMPNLAELTWSHSDQLTKVKLPSNAGWAFYNYDANGQRIRKVVTNSSGKSVRIYFGEFEIFRRYDNGDVSFERHTLHVMDDQNRIALVEAKREHDVYANWRVRYQLGNHLGSSVLEVDGRPSAAVINYEEFCPFGGTAYVASQNYTGIESKRYRYSGKERDYETGLYYYGARYYAVWLGRWLSSDPSGMRDGSNLFQYVKNNPIVLIDRIGNNAMPTEEKMRREFGEFQQWYGQLSPRAKFEFDKVFIRQRFQEIKKWEDQVILGRLPDGIGYVGKRKDFIDTYNRQTFQYQLQVLDNIRGGIFGAIGYGIGGERGSFVGAVIDQMTAAAALTSARRQYNESLSQTSPLSSGTTMALSPPISTQQSTKPRAIESKGASTRGSTFISATAQTRRSGNTAIRADLGESQAYGEAIFTRGEIGIQRPLGANVRGVDFITAVRNAKGHIEILVTDVKTSTIGKFPKAATTLPGRWRSEVSAAISSGRLDLGNKALESEIKAAFSAGRVRLRQVNVDFSPEGQGRMTGF